MNFLYSSQIQISEDSNAGSRNIAFCTCFHPKKYQQSCLVSIKKEPVTVSNLTCYRLCVLASGSLITDIFNCFTLIIVSCLHLGQNSGEFSSTVSSRILTHVLLPQTGHNIHSYLHIVPSLYLIFLLTIIILMPANFKLLCVYMPALRRYMPLA